MRRNRVVSMTKADIATLEVLYNGGDELVMPPAVIADNIGFSAARIRERAKPLRETNLIEYYDKPRGVYQIADRGRRYVTGEMSEEEAKELDEDLSEYSS
jgi:predicted transcriptional regulator